LPPVSPTSIGTRCAGVTTARALVLFAYTPGLNVVDATDPVHPKLLCSVAGASGGRFVSATTVAVWNTYTAEVVDITNGKVVRSQKLPASPFEGAFTSDAGLFAYRVEHPDGSDSVHILDMASGTDRVLYTQAPLGGHGGPIGGPVVQLQFSPDGTELLDFDIFRPQGGTASLQVLRLDGSIIFQASDGVAGMWAPTGATLYMVVREADQTDEDLVGVSRNGSQSILMQGGLTGVNWPVLSPDGKSILFDTYDSSTSGQATGGLPHLWSLDIVSALAGQISDAVSTEPVFIGTNVVWSNEEQPCECGMGGASQPDGFLIAHDLGTHTDTRVDAELIVPAPGAPPTTYNIQDVRLSR
jgi:hypothetical protein